MKNNRVRLIAFVVIVALYAFLFACWMFHVPYNEAELFRAMPHNADMVSSHVDLPARFMRGATIADNFGFLSPKVLEARKAMAASREFRKIFAAPELRTKRSVVGYIHRLDGEPACFFATWLGRHGQIMRWSLLWKTPPHLVRTSTDYGYPIWSSRSAASNDQVLSFAFVDGMLLGCISRNPAGVRHALETYDGHLPSVAAAKIPEYVAPLIPNPKAPDTGWFRTRTRPIPGMPHIVAFSFDSVEAPCIRGAFQSDMPLAADSPLAAPVNLDGLENCFGKAPSAVLAMPSDLLAGALEAAPRSLPVEVASALLHSGAVAQSGPVAAGLFLGEFGGRIHLALGRPRIPALSLAVRLGDRDRVREGLTRAADLVNGVFRAGLIVSPAAILPGNTPFYGFEMTSSNSAAMQRPEDLPGCALAGNWLVLSSHAQSLQNVLSQTLTGSVTAAQTEAQPPEWQRLLREKAAGAFFWADLEATGKELDTLLVFSQMAGFFPRETPGVRAIIKKCRTFRTGAAWIELVNNRPRLCLEIGRPNAQ